MAPAIKNTMFGKYFKHVLVLTFLAGIAYSLPQVKEAMAGAFAFTYTENSAAVVQATVKNQVLIHGVTAKVNYDSSHKESNLILTAKATVTAGTSDITVGNSLFSFILKNKTLNVDAAQINSSILSTSLKKNADGTYTVKKGTKATFVGSNDKFNPQQLIAGQYYATVVAVNTTTGKIIPSSNKSNPVTVVGEASPYITLSGKGIYGVNNKVTVNGVRLGKEIKVTVESQDMTGFSKTFKVNVKEKATQFSFNLADYGVVPGNYYLYVVNTKLGDVAGKSNNVSFSVLNQDRIINAKVAVGTLALSYDSAKKESLLSAPFLVTIKAGKEKLAFNDASFYVVARNELGNERVAPTVIRYINKVKPTSLPFALNPGVEATFEIVSAVNPQTLFAGNYVMSVGGVYPANNGTTSPLFIQIPDNKTNSVAILGESSPYINSVTNPVAVGSKMIINGFRMAGSQVFIDGAPLTNTVVAGSVDGTVLQFDLPMLTNGSHQIYVKSEGFGESNAAYFESTGGTDVPPVVVCPVGYICEPVPPTTPQVPDCPAGYTCTVVTTPATCYTFNYNLTVGATGADVSALQKYLISRGFNIPDITSGQSAPGYFGNTTKAAVIAFQTSVGQPATGFVGPLTRAVLNACGPVTPVPTPSITVTSPNGVVWEKGTIKKITWESNLASSEDVYIELVVDENSYYDITSKYDRYKNTGSYTWASAGQLPLHENIIVPDGKYTVRVCNVSRTACNQKSVSLVSPKLTPSITVVSPNGGEVWQIGKNYPITWKSEGLSSDAYKILIGLIDNKGNTVMTIGNIGSNDGSEMWTIPSSVAPGNYKIMVVCQSLACGSLNNYNGVADSSDSYFTISKPVTPPDNSSNSYQNVSLGVSIDASTPDAGIVMVDENSNTNNVALLVGKIKAIGTANLKIKEFPVTVAVNGATDVDAVASTLKLRIGGEEFVKTLNTSASSAVVTFNNLDLEINAGTTVTFTVLADINDIEAGSFNEGSLIVANVTTSNVGAIVSNAALRSGSAIGQAQEFRTAGPLVTLVSTNTDATTGTSANDDVGMFTIKYKVTATGGDLYIGSTTASHIYRVEKNGTTVVSNALSAAVVNNTDTTMTSKGNYVIEEGESETFTLYITAPLPAVGTSGQYRAALTGIKWDSIDTVVPAKTLTSGLESFVTNYMVLN